MSKFKVRTLGLEVQNQIWKFRLVFSLGQNPGCPPSAPHCHHRYRCCLWFLVQEPAGPEEAVWPQNKWSMTQKLSSKGKKPNEISLTSTKAQGWQDWSALEAVTLSRPSAAWSAWKRRRRKGTGRIPAGCIELGLVTGGWPEAKAWRCLFYSLVREQWSGLCPREAEIQTSIYPHREASDCQRLEWVLSLYVNHSLEKARVNSMSCYTNSRMKHNFLLQCSQSRCTSSEPNARTPVSQMSSVGAVAFAASVELTSSPPLLVDSVGNSRERRNINIKGKEFKERVFETRSFNTVGFHACSVILYCWELILKARVTEGEWMGKSSFWGTAAE